MRLNLVILLVVGVSFSRECFGLFVQPTVHSIDDVVHYLKRFGYLSEDANSTFPNAKVAASSLRHNLETFQRLAGLEVTGEIDIPTVNKMREPRCGLPDNIGPDGRRRKRQASEHGLPWPKFNLTYRVNSFPTNSPFLNNDKILNLMKIAIESWGSVTPLKFKAVTDKTMPVDIDILFAEGYHRYCDWDFSDNLAHAFYPLWSQSGDAHFSDIVSWADFENIPGTYDLRQTAMHEFGHSLGLDHIFERNVIMTPYYSFFSDLSLRKSDIDAIQSLYGPKPESSPPGGGDQGPTGGGTSLCSGIEKIDAITNANKQLYVFSGDKYFVLDESLNGPSAQSRLIKDTWPEVVSDVDAVLYDNTNGEPGKLVFFKGYYVYSYSSSNKLESGFPKHIRDVVRGLPGYVESAFLMMPNEIYYFTKGTNLYISLNINGGSITAFSPWSFAGKSGMPSKFDASTTWTDGRIYAITGSNYYRVSDIYEADAGFPKPWRTWFSCPAA